MRRRAKTTPRARVVLKPHPVAAAGWFIPSEASIGSNSGDETIEGRYANRWEAGLKGGMHKECAAADASHALEAFIALATATDYADDAVADFVVRFGQIGVDVGWIPVPRVAIPEYPDERIVGRDWRPGTGVWIEPLDAYAAYARLARSTIRVAENLRDERVPHVDDIDLLAQFLRTHHEAYEGKPKPPAEQHLPAFMFEWIVGVDREAHRLLQWDRSRWCYIVQSVVNWWLECAAVQPLIAWHGRSPVQEWSGGLWGVLGVQLMFAVLHAIEPRCRLCGGAFISPADAKRLGIGPRHPRAHLVRLRPGRPGVCRSCKPRDEAIRQQRFRRERAG
jgi:hypothetical protein